jgi:hypothetical protein
MKGFFSNPAVRLNPELPPNAAEVIVVADRSPAVRASAAAITSAATCRHCDSKGKQAEERQSIEDLRAALAKPLIQTQQHR